MPHHQGDDRDDPADATERELHRISHDWESETPLGSTIVRAVSAVTGKPASELTPLFTVVDPDALDALFRPLSAACPRNDGTVSFPFEGTWVSVCASGDITIAAPKADRSE